MGLFNHHNNTAATNDPAAVPASSDPYYDNTTTNPNQGNFRRDVEGGAGGAFIGREWEKHHGGTGPGAGTGAVLGGIGAHEYNKHHNAGPTNAGYDTTTTGATTANQTYDPAYDNTNAGTNQGNFRRDVEGAGVGGFAGREWEKHHGGSGPGPVTGAAVGGLAAHEYNRHHNQTSGAYTGAGPDPTLNTSAGAGMTGLGAGATGTGLGTQAGRAPGMSSNQPPTTAAMPSAAEARKLERSGKIETMLGTVLCSTTLKEKGMAKENEAYAIRTQAQNLAEAEALEAQARARRGVAVGMGAHQDHLNPSAAPTSVTSPTMGGGAAY